MFRRKTLKRLTRFGLCFYVFSYCMALTVCAEEYPLIGGTDAANGSPPQGQLTYVESAVTDSEADVVDFVEGEESAEVDAATPDPDPEAKLYNGSAVTGLFWQIWDVVKSSTDSSDTPYSVYLENDLTVDNNTYENQLVTPTSRVGDVTVDGRGKTIYGDLHTAQHNMTNLEDFRFFHYLTFKNTVFKEFTDDVFVDNWNDLGTKKNSFTFINCTFDGNKRAFYSIQNDTVSFINCTFIDNHVDGDGGVIFLNSSGKLEVEGCSFISNTAGGKGGAIVVLDENREIIIDDCLFESNAADKGGAIYDRTARGYEVYDSRFFNNMVNANSNGGGAIYRENVTTSNDSLMRNAFLNNTEPEIVMADIDDKDSIGTFLNGNWFGGTVDQVMKEGALSTMPSILLLSGDEGVYSWKLLNMERWGAWSGGNASPRLYFYVYAGSDCYSNGTVVFDGPKNDVNLANVTFNCIGENITLEKDNFVIGYDGNYNRGNFTGIIKQGVKTYSVTLTDPVGNVLLTRTYDRTIDKWGVILENFGNATVSNRTSYEPAIEGDTLSLRAYTNIYTTSENGSLERDPDDPYVGTVTTGPNLMNETIHVKVNGEEFGDFVTDSNGYFNISTDDLEIELPARVNMTFTSDVTSGEVSITPKRIIPKGHTDVMSSSAGESNSLVVRVESPTAPLDEGTLSVYYNNSIDGEKKLLKSWDMSTVLNTSFETVLKDLNETLEPGLYTFEARYTCDSGKFKNSSEDTGYGGKSMIIGSEGFTCTDLMSGSSKNTLEARLLAIGNLTSGNVSVWYMPASGGEKTLHKQWVLDAESGYYGSGQYSFWGDLNVSSIPDGKYIFIVEYKCPDGSFNDSICEREITLPIEVDNPEGLEDAEVSITGGNSLTKNLSDGNFTLNVTAANPGEGNGSWSFSSSNEAVATVDATGLVSLKAVGNTSITAIYNSSTTWGKAVLHLTVVDTDPDNPDGLDDAEVSFADGESLTKNLSDGNFTLNVTAANPGEGNGSWSFSSSNESVATVDDTGLVSLKAVGITNITAVYNSSTTWGKAVLILTVIAPEGDTGNTGNNTNVPETINGSVIQNLPIDLGSELAAANITLNVSFTQNISFMGNKFKTKDIVDMGNGTYSIGGVVIKLNTTLLDFSKPSFKFKNVKHASDNPKSKKPACFVISFKANTGTSKENKTAVKTANKVLKKNPVEFKIEQADISKATDGKVYLNGKKTKVTKATMTIGEKNFTLKNSKDFDAVIADPNVTLTGKGDYKGNLTVTMN